MRVYIKSYKKDTIYASLKLYMESYFDLTLCAVLGGLAFVNDYEKGETFADYFRTPDDIFNSAVTIMYISLAVIFPLFGYAMIMRYWTKLKKSST